MHWKLCMKCVWDGAFAADQKRDRLVGSTIFEKGLDYKSRESMTSKGKWGEEYETFYNGKKVSIEQHLALGKGGPDTCLKFISTPTLIRRGSLLLTWDGTRRTRALSFGTRSYNDGPARTTPVKQIFSADVALRSGQKPYFYGFSVSI